METLSVVCPHCFVKNRVPEARLADGPSCGGCHEALFTRKPVPVNSAQLKKMVSGNDIPVLVDFWASWCGPCRAFAPVYEGAAESLEPRVRLLKLNTEHNEDSARVHGIRSIPTMILFREGREVRRQSGAMAPPDFINWVNQAAQV